MTLCAVTRPAAKPTLRLVLLHGYGSDEQDMLGLAHELPPEFDVVCLRAPLELEGHGFSWFDLSIDASGFGFDEEGFKLSAAMLLEAVPHLRMPSLPFVIGGFSQGAMMAAATLLLDAEVNAAWLMSGAFPPGLEMPNSPSRPVLVQHGVSDGVLPIAMGRGLVKGLTDSGMAVDWREYPMAHSVSSASLRDGIEWLEGLEVDG